MFEVSNEEVDPDFGELYEEIYESERFLTESMSVTLGGIDDLKKVFMNDLAIIKKSLPTKEEYQSATDEYGYNEFDSLKDEFSRYENEIEKISEIIQQQRRLFFVLHYNYFEIWFLNFFNLIQKKYGLTSTSRDNQMENLWKSIKDSFKELLSNKKNLEQQWDVLKAFAAIRNCIVHCKSDTSLVKEDDKNKTDMSCEKLKKKGISIKESHLILEGKFFEEFQKTYMSFFKEVQKELGGYEYTDKYEFRLFSRNFWIGVEIN